MVDVHWPWNELVREVLPQKSPMYEFKPQICGEKILWFESGSRRGVLINVNLEEVSGFAINWEMKYADTPAGERENVCFGIKDCLNYYRSKALPLRDRSIDHMKMNGV
uniref:Uncharacterized protein n=1 Tax=Romanomermis culicivorax TaxID=13658 RepID=A0A915HVX6_ROMCU